VDQGSVPCFFSVEPVTRNIYSGIGVRFPDRPSSISADGSDRQFKRVSFHGRAAVQILPSTSEAGIRESWSFFHIGTHLSRAGVPVPEIFYFDRDSGTLVVEDLGDTLFYHVIQSLKRHDRIPDLFHAYRDAVRLLIDFQRLSTPNFNTAWCFDTPLYNGDFAWEREALYFMDSFLEGFCGVMVSTSLRSELSGLCRRVDAAVSEPVLIHRDFQSRNIMIKHDRLRIIDFQGARLGPWGYDLASLLYDPYVDLPEEMRSRLLDLYLADAMGSFWSVTRAEMMDEFYCAALLRTLQVLGAFSFLSREKRRSFFAPFIKPALKNLHVLVHKEVFSALSDLRALSVTLLQ